MHAERAPPRAPRSRKWLRPEGTEDLLEMRSLRDVRVMVALLYFLVFTHFLFSQEIWTVLWLLGTVVGITGLLVEVNTRAATADTETDPWRQHWRAGAVIVAQALPLMVVFFVLFPRIPGPLWGLPADAGSSRSGGGDRESEAWRHHGLWKSSNKNGYGCLWIRIEPNRCPCT